jgi:hypothetical protein
VPLSGPIPEGTTFFCPHCGALYSITLSRPPKIDSNIPNSHIAKCVVGKHIMDEWASTESRI